MDLSYGSEMEGFREEVLSFVEENWPIKAAEGEEALSFERQASVFSRESDREGVSLSKHPEEIWRIRARRGCHQGSDHSRGAFAQMGSG